MKDILTTSSSFKMYQPPAAVGYWCISPNFFVSMTKKPNWFHIKMVTLILGWEWRNEI
jgi:hypothetical protein